MENGEGGVSSVPITEGGLTSGHQEGRVGEPGGAEGEGRCVMANGGCGLMGFGLSSMVRSLGSRVTALLDAPRTGARRRRLAECADGVREGAGGVTEEATEKFHTVIEPGRRLVIV